VELLRNADVHAPHSLGIRDLLIGGGRVLAMAPTLPPPPPEYGVRITDCEGRRLVPGFVDGHAHLTGGGGEAGFRTRVPALTLSAFTRAGITTAVGLLGTDDVARSTAELLATAKALAEEGLTTFCWTGGYHVPPTTLTGSVRGDLVRVTEIVGAGEIAISDHRSSQPTLDELLRLAADVHVGGLQTGKAGILHLHVGDGVRGLDLIRRAITATELPARVFHPTHVNRRRALFDEALALAADGVTIDVTAFAPDPDDTDAIAADAAIVRYLGTGLPAHRLTVSSDGGGCMPRFDAEGRVRGFTIGAPAELAACPSPMRCRRSRRIQRNCCDCRGRASSPSARTPISCCSTTNIA
jgi:beta-aspartyl-dipeptidase (metallo-type)